MRIRNPFRRKPAPPGFGGTLIPEESANWLSILAMQWLSPLLSVGASRPLEKEDLWALGDSKLTGPLTEQVETNFFLRCEPAKRPRHLRDRLALLEGLSEQEPDAPDVKGKQAEDSKEDSSKEKAADESASAEAAPANSPYDESLFKAIHRTFIRDIWLSGSLILISDTLRTTTPLVLKVFLTWITEAYVWARVRGTPAESLIGATQPLGIGFGIGVAFALFAMQELASIFSNHGLKISMATGQSVKAGLVGSIVRKSLRISGRARVDHSIGQIITMISTDGTNLEQFTAFAHSLWVSPIQLILGFGLLIGTLGYSALVGLGVIVFSFPIQMIFVKIFFAQRNKCIKITDKRVQLTTEVLNGIRMIKFYGWEAFYIDQINHFRGQEIKTLRKAAFALAGLICTFHFTPVCAAILSFITYSLTGHDLNVAVIFSALSLFNVITIPLLLFPLALSSMASALIALGRIGKFLSAEELQDPYLLQPDSAMAVEVDAAFTWEAAQKVDKEKDGDAAAKDGKAKDKDKKAKADKKKKDKSANGKPDSDSSTLPSSTQDMADDAEKKEPDEDPPFELKDLRMSVPKGSLVGIVGKVGSGKSSVLQGIIGEMRRTRGQVIIGGDIAYVPQVPWIQNATLRENIVFGQKDSETRFREVVNSCGLTHDLEFLPHGERTEIGEKGVNLSGGQKARVSLARAAYSKSDIILMDDPLSAVDAYVGKHIMDHCILSGPLASRTRVLVTHSLHVLDKMDYIYYIESGRITEEGTYDDLISHGGPFSKLIEEYGRTEGKGDKSTATGPRVKRKGTTGAAEDDVEDGGLDKAAKDVLMQLEERSTGAVTWDTYKLYLRFAGGIVWVPVILALLVIAQAFTVGTSLWLGFWASNEFPQLTPGHYMGVYAAFGLSGAIVTLLEFFAFATMGLVASLRLFRKSLSGILHSPLSFFDTTPMGRILSRLTKDFETLDNELSQILFSFLTILMALLGVVALIFYTFPYLGIIFAPLSILYWVVAKYYRYTSVETKRLDSVLRSGLYASVSETLTGLATIRAYKKQEVATSSADQGLDLQNRAYYMTVTIQRWLGLRLDLFGNLLVLGIGLFAVGFRETVDPGKVGVVLTYTLSVTAIFSDMISQFAMNEQNMNAVERIVHYAELPAEGQKQPQEPPPNWPAEGAVKFQDVKLAYREGLPLVLKGVDFSVRPREKIGIVGRTGAGKSSLLHALFRTVELSEGSVEIDGIDIKDIRLETLRTRLALVPQDSTLFLGTLRKNLDPQGIRTDAELIEVLQRASLLPQTGQSDPVAEAKFSLDSVVGNEGSNFSVGEKQLLSLSRALVRNSRIIVLDEATSNVDVETDAKLQRTIRKEFASSTVLCIAHRLNTIAYCDRILVMDNGVPAEFDTVLDLYDRGNSIFRSLCDEANLTRADILRIRADQTQAVPSL
ncbi:cadmium ion transporter [Coprinopsis marcescibilis]|uniref:Cadmium ion transporter n=1 Tax=Coprinopsis marcescibilis TaxID=230819 RepID=A0A5C3KIA1_COPMA|nr:cadmium ion transporter [Coprinopsis marcescibilis]